MNTKRCPSCKETRLTKEFSKHNTNRDGLQSRCKECEKAHYRKNKARINAYYNSKYSQFGEFFWRVKLKTSTGAKELAKPFMEKYLANPCCAYCNTKLQPFEVSVDHMQPRSREGLDIIENLAVSCKDCNQLKHDRTVEEFKQFLTQYIQRFSGNEAEGQVAHRERLSESDPNGDMQQSALIGNMNYEKLAEMTNSLTLQ